MVPIGAGTVSVTEIRLCALVDIGSPDHLSGRARRTILSPMTFHSEHYCALSTLCMAMEHIYEVGLPASLLCVLFPAWAR